MLILREEIKVIQMSLRSLESHLIKKLVTKHVLLFSILNKLRHQINNNNVGFSNDHA